jgi:uncharacterized repeat protein (TIGR03803 family)
MIGRLEASGAPALLAMFVLVAIGTSPAPAPAQTYTVVYKFHGPPTDGESPEAGLIGDSAGNLYGTTYYGGASNAGVVFRLNKTGETVLHSFAAGVDGANPAAGLIQDSAGNLYGTAAAGGTSDAGVVFKLDTAGTETVLYNFGGFPSAGNGAQPVASLIQGREGDLYGTARYGGASGHGVVFKLDTAGTETVLYSFTGGADGANPRAGLIRDSAGNLYGTTFFGGGDANCFSAGCGVVFELNKTGETVLYSFIEADGANPAAGVIRDSAGNFYGTAGGGSDACLSGCGVVFELDPAGTETVLHSFTGGADGAYPNGLIRDSAGNLYGTANGGALGYGVIFKLDTTGTETVLYTFTGAADGGGPFGDLIRDSSGNLFGTTAYGGAGACTYGCGVVFKLEP